jgi:hypothetical protein
MELVFLVVALLLYASFTRWIYGTGKIISLLQEVAVNLHDIQLFLKDIRKQNQILIQQQSEIPDSFDRNQEYK